MRITRQQFLALLPGLALARAGHAQGFAFSHPVRLILSTPPGGGADVTTRLIAPQVAERIGQQLVIESRPGGSGLIAGGYVAQQAADGHVFLVDIATHTANPALGRAMPYRVLEDLVPVTQVVRGANALVVHPSLPVTSLAEFIALAKEKGGTLTYASSGNGSAQHTAMEMFRDAAGIRLTHVPYRGGGPALVDVMAGHVSAFFAFIPSAMQHIRAGRIRALATTGSVRSPSFPELPTVAESGFPGFESYDWNGIFAPARTPPGAIAGMQAAVAQAMAVPELRARIDELGLEPVASEPAAFRAMLEADIAKWTAAVSRYGIRVD
ncbi:tripartite tricarboxylate transporter substrate binding protein [Roseomonas populi]|uniref:Tripartite tricarboxylate transporter substrate binding protein n=1 Tax=Roseomonas populi TaxID=3121582 RepID=A0ABT1X593_9PROT|nr:tripartite tricarboxylate transporter substrate binding protein [Roseomonas pecuniae]MCR0983279.1 tripartite tricarboxylate transporter substrate binding protein [Roseomonas pecuniae]